MTCVFPNLGAEEGPTWRRHLDRPQVTALALGFHSLFGRAQFAPGLPQSLLDMASASASATEPAFRWLSPSGGRAEEMWAWLPNEESQALAAELGLRAAGPSPGTVRRVHDKAFAVAAMPDERLALWTEVFGKDGRRLTWPNIEQTLARWPEPLRGRWVLKPRWGTSGRRRVQGPRAPTSAALARLEQRGGAVLEPWLERVADFSVQLYISEDHEALLLGTTDQQLSQSGVYTGNTGFLDEQGRPCSRSDFRPTLEQAAQRLGTLAAEEGFFGPCGVDAFSYRKADGEVALRPVVELNARFTGGTVLAGRLQRLFTKGGARPGDGFIYDATTDTLALQRDGEE